MLSLKKKIHFRLQGFQTFERCSKQRLLLKVGKVLIKIPLSRGSQPVVRVPLVVREDVPGGTQKVRNLYFFLEKLIFYGKKFLCIANIEWKVPDITEWYMVFSFLISLPSLFKFGFHVTYWGGTQNFLGLFGGTQLKKGWEPLPLRIHFILHIMMVKQQLFTFKHKRCHVCTFSVLTILSI